MEQMEQMDQMDQMDQILEENLKLISIIESTKKKFHEHVNIIYSVVNTMKQEQPQQSQQHIAKIIEVLNKCIDQVLGQDDQECIRNEWHIDQKEQKEDTNINETYMLQQLIKSKKELEKAREEQQDMVDMLQELDQQKEELHQKHDELLSTFAKSPQLFPNHEGYSQNSRLLDKDVQSLMSNEIVEILKKDKQQLQQEIQSIREKKQKYSQFLIYELNQLLNVFAFISALAQAQGESTNQQLLEKQPEIIANYERAKIQLNKIIGAENQVVFSAHQNQSQISSDVLSCHSLFNQSNTNNIKPQLDEEITSLQNIIQNRNNESSIYLEQLQQVYKDFELLSKENQNLKDQIDILKQIMLNNCQSIQKNTQSDHDKIKDQKEKNYLEKIEELLDQCQKYEKQLKDYQKQISSKDNSILSIQNQFDQGKNQFEQIQSKYGDQLQQLIQQLSEQQQFSEQLIKQNNGLKQQIADKESKVKQNITVSGQKTNQFLLDAIVIQAIQIEKSFKK